MTREAKKVRPARRKDPVVCTCLGLCEAELRQAVRTHGLFDLAALAAKTEAGTGCNCCHPDLRRLIQGERERVGYFAPPNCSVR